MQEKCPRCGMMNLGEEKYYCENCFYEFIIIDPEEEQVRWS